ncbi:MAG: preprotein translocase subunit SecG [Candidatus Levybacteria bacterium RIFOXYA1_FULL_41_10]|nr:MAG: Preprotein translocase, SecG subunit [Candidatus Levybacteria bacterium GW2011_GWC2_40_7]OGH21154.1 MAG: preprotein translocase subunit SecG [Candidatus Levybacteria bacterium RIFCSPHIGHO2_01_FULL_40_83]OGH27429.1 MAG: preprotein translocase subunit SecG [Candidatus Levybacteria bacterium RIFCSPHIGHO2_02_FULL_40_29]OGH30354.1 MAG: preprotein translocase subunit SecG [Candidatus Levybacteria bacterium RIFCSPHIGHO2_12_FULL_40_44]OGH41986.1 MAG: preprotein translocase subunit SecG [Candida
MVLFIFEIIIAAALIGVILLQMQGSGLSASFGGSGGEFYRSRRSMEKILVWATIILATLFAVLSLLLLIPR